MKKYVLVSSLLLCASNFIMADTQPISFYGSGNYTVQEEILPALVIDADSATLDLQGNTIDAQGADYGIFIQGHSHVTIKNGSILNARTAGIFCNNCAYITLENISILNTGSFAVESAIGIQCIQDEGYALGHITLINCNVCNTNAKTSAQGIVIGQDNCTLKNCSVDTVCIDVPSSEQEKQLCTGFTLKDGPYIALKNCTTINIMGNEYTEGLGFYCDNVEYVRFKNCFARRLNLQHDYTRGFALEGAQKVHLIECGVFTID